MKRLSSLLATLFLACGIAAADAAGSVIRKGGLIGSHLEESAPLVKTYGKPTSLLDTPSSVAARSEVMMWKVGEGVLVIETSFSAGIIHSMTYVIVASDGKKRTTLTVKQFDPVTREMTIVIPNTEPAAMR